MAWCVCCIVLFLFSLAAGLAGLGGAGAGMPPMDDALMQQLAKDDACKTQ